MMPTPTIVAMQERPYGAVPAERQTTTVGVLYVTDRAPAPKPGRPVWYGHRRAAQMVFGVGFVRLGVNLSWDQLAAATSTSDRRSPIPLQVIAAEELGSLPSPLPTTEAARAAHRLSPAELAEQERELSVFYEALAARLDATAKKDVYVYVHGFKRWFEDGLYTMAEMWHYAGREGVPIVYSWPAGAPGLLRAYNRDRESGEFTVHHLKSFLIALSRAPGVERIHLIAHSRGADVLISALRELNMAYVAAGLSTRAELKLENVMLAAPDMDSEVAQQNLVAEGLFEVAERFTIYVSGTDTPLEVADWLFDGKRRVGRLRYADVAPEADGSPSAMHGACIIDVTLDTPGLGHEYFYDQPQVASDVLLMLAQGRSPGAEHGRPLTPKAPGWWELDRNYLLEPTK